MALLLQECINDLFDAGFNSDKLPLIFLENETAKVAIKTGNTLSKRVDIRNIVMQGSVWGSLMCTASMSKVGDLAYKNKELYVTHIKEK